MVKIQNAMSQTTIQFALASQDIQEMLCMVATKSDVKVIVSVTTTRPVITMNVTIHAL